MQAVNGNVDSIIPLYINRAMPEWFSYLFMLTLLAAAMSTISAQFHVQGTAAGHDIYETLKGKAGKTVTITRVGILISIIIAVVLAFILPGSVVAQGTSIFFGLCASAFLPMFACALFWKRATKPGAIAGLLTGTFVSLFWLLFVHQKEAAGIGLCKLITGSTVLIKTMPWPVVDPIVVALPLAFVVTVLVSLLTKPPEKEVLDSCFGETSD